MKHDPFRKKRLENTRKVSVEINKPIWTKEGASTGGQIKHFGHVDMLTIDLRQVARNKDVHTTTPSEL